MNDHRHGADDGDAGFRRQYRQLSDESAPPGLDQKILRAAAKAAGGRAARWSPLLRPLTILASLAIAIAAVLQFTAIDNSHVIGPQGGGADRVPVQAGGIADPGRDSGDDGICANEMRATRADWQRCIQGLIEDGRLDDARRQQRLLDIAFPE